MRQGSRLRGVIDEQGQRWSFRIQRVRCRNCNSSHSLVPDFLVPYKRYSVSALLESVLRFVSGMTYLKAVSEPVGDTGTLFEVIENILKKLPVAARLLLERMSGLFKTVRTGTKFRSKNKEKRERLEWLSELVSAEPGIFEILNCSGICIFGSGRGCELLRTPSTECKLF